MEAGPAPVDRPRMDPDTFTENFGTNTPHKTYLCYEWKVLEDGSRIPADQLKGFLRNQGADSPWGPCHAELCFLERIRSWGLDKNKHYSGTLFISWSPCPVCAHRLAEFLGQNRRVSLRIFASRIYGYVKGYEDGLRQLQAAGAQVSLMRISDYQYCWRTFVDHQEQPFQPQADLLVHSLEQSKRLDEILGIRGN
ncbi:DNA dC-_dU-editing enzyme APOBEC-3G-like [Glossophaga mutica]